MQTCMIYIYIQMQTATLTISTCGCANKLLVNAGKTKYIVLRLKHMKHNLSQYKIHIGDTVLSRIGNYCFYKTTIFLAMHLGENLCWKFHINEVNKKV